MFAIQDGPIRLIVLTHVVARLQQIATDDLLQAGIEPDQVDRIRTLDASDIERLAALPLPRIELALDRLSVNSGLRQLAILKDVHFLEQYFIRHGASPKMMKALFTMRFSTTRALRQELGLKSRYGRPVLPKIDIRDRIHESWAAHTKLNIRQRYYQLHKAFPQHRFDTLHAVITEFDRSEQ